MILNLWKLNLLNDFLLCRPKMVVLGSREQLCIHDRVSLLHGKAQTNACHLLRRNRSQDEEDKQHEKREKPRCAHYYRVSGMLIKFNECVHDY